MLEYDSFYMYLYLTLLVQYIIRIHVKKCVIFDKHCRNAHVV